MSMPSSNLASACNLTNSKKDPRTLVHACTHTKMPCHPLAHELHGMCGAFRHFPVFCGGGRGIAETRREGAGRYKLPQVSHFALAPECVVKCRIMA